MAKPRWQRGVSFGSAGRLGAHAAGFEPAENGYLTYQSDGPTFMRIGGERTVIGSLQLPPRHSVDEKTLSWTLRVTRYRAPAQPGCPATDLSVLGSVLSPAITFASDRDRVFRWRWPVGASPQWCAFPSGAGVTVAHYSRGYPLRETDAGAAYLFGAGVCQKAPPGKVAWNAPWLVTFSLGGAGVPVLWVFHGSRPRRIEVTSYEYLDVRFSRPFRRISAMPLYGAAEVDRAALRGLCGGRGLKALRTWGDHWARVLPKLPDDVDETFRIDEAAGTVEVRSTGRRLDGRRPSVSPVPPFLAAAATTRYPVVIQNASAAPRGMPELCSHYGPYRVVKGGVLRYAMPLCPYLDTILSPVRVLNDRGAAALTRKLRSYFDDPRHTYGGDGTYDPDTLLDILHNLRVLAWAAWSLPDDQRPAAQAAIVRDFDALFRPGSYRRYREPTTGRTVARDPKIFDWCGDVTYDIDWYSGMNLAGLWAGVYFGAISAETVRRRWKLVCDIAAYFEVFQDWATLAPWTDMRGELLNIDCARHGAQGMIGFARLADRFGDRKKRDLARCIASRYMVFWAAEHALPQLYGKGDVRTRGWGGAGGQLELGFGGLRERNDAPSVVRSGARNPYTLSPLNPEHLLFLRDYGPVERLERYEADVLDGEVPGWDARPAEVYFKTRGPDSIERNTGAYHFYMVDPHLFLRMLALDWPSRRALGKVKELSGQVMAAVLVADAPKVLCPAALTFAGTTWDARQRVLSIHARAASAVRATWQVLWPDKPGKVVGPRGSTHRFCAGRLTLVAPCEGDVEWRIQY